MELEQNQTGGGFNFNVTFINQKFLIAVGIILVAAIALFFFGRRSNTTGPPRVSGELEIWGVFDNTEAFSSMLEAYEKTRGVKIVYKKRAFESYERDLIGALAAGRGPDIAMVHNTWVSKHSDILTPAPPGWATPPQMQATFPDVVVKDFTDAEENVWAMPLYIDTLALYYNRDYFNTAGITTPPQTWTEFLDAVEKLVQRDERNRIIRAGAALGAAENVNRSTDILSLLMLQSGTDIVNRESRSARFANSLRSADGESFVPGEDALRFYTDFADPTKRVYTWNRDLDFSIDMFVTGRAAMMVNYQHHIPTIRAKATSLNFGVASVPQIADGAIDINYASYWGLAVTRGSDAPQESWRFLLFSAQREHQESYQETTGRPPARRDMIEALKDDPNVGLFARQALSARTWFQPDPTAVETVLADAITSVVANEASVERAIRTAQERISELLRQQR